MKLGLQPGHRGPEPPADDHVALVHAAEPPREVTERPQS
jgi:hypothetical protein